MANAMGSIIVTVKGKDITVANSAPSSPLINDLWLDLQNDILKTYDGTDWVAVNDQSSAISDIQETLTTQGLSITQNANGISQLITNTTIAKQDGTVVQLKDAYNSTKDTVDSHTQTIGTLTTTVGTLSEDLAEFSSTTSGNIASLQEQIDGSIMTWFYGVAPTLSNSPASNWNTVDLKNKHLGDLYYDTITGYCYRWQVLNNTYSWQRITDTDVTKALSDASKAQDTADSKRRVFTVQPTTPYDVGDLWSGGSNGDLMRCKVARSTGSYISSDWEKAAKYTDDTKANEVEDNLTNNYYDITQISTTLEQTTNSIMASVSNSYAAKAELALKIGEDGIARISAEADEIAFESDKFSLNSTNLKISKTGVIEATGAKIVGEVTANSGKIGSFYLTSEGALYSGSPFISGPGTYIGGAGISCSNADGSRMATLYGSKLALAQNTSSFNYDDVPRIVFSGYTGTGTVGGTLSYIVSNDKLSWTGNFQTAKDISAGGRLTVASDADITGHTFAHGNILIDNNYGLYIKDADGNNRNGIVIDGSNKYLIAAGAIPNAKIQLGCPTTANVVVYGDVNMAADKVQISAKTSGNCPVFKSASGVVQFSAGSDSDVNYISGSEVRVTNLARTAYKVIKASAFTVSSSRRLKHNIEPMSEDEALKLQKLNVVTFDYNNGESNQRGLIAEDTYEIIPSAVQGDINAPDDDEDAIMGIGIDYSKLVPYLIKNVQMQEKRIQALETKILNLQ